MKNNKREQDFFFFYFTSFLVYNFKFYIFPSLYARSISISELIDRLYWYICCTYLRRECECSRTNEQTLTQENKNDCIELHLYVLIVSNTDRIGSVRFSSYLFSISFHHPTIPLLVNFLFRTVAFRGKNAEEKKKNQNFISNKSKKK